LIWNSHIHRKAAVESMMSSTLGDTGSSGLSLKQQRPQQQTVTTTNSSAQVNGIGGRPDVSTISCERGLTPSSSIVVGSEVVESVPTKAINPSSEPTPQPVAAANRPQLNSTATAAGTGAGKAVDTLERKVYPSPSVITSAAL
jgi:hypothetical protein